MQFLQSLFKVLSYVPLVWLGLLYSFALLASIELGHFPVKYIDDPKYLNVPLVFEIVAFGLVFTIYSFLPWLAIFVVAIVERWKLIRNLIVFSLGAVLFFVQARLDPFDLIAWLLD